MDFILIIFLQLVSKEPRHLFVVTCFGHCLHNANLKVCFSRALVAVATHAFSDVTAFFKAAMSSILRSLMVVLVVVLVPVVMIVVPVVMMVMVMMMAALSVVVMVMMAVV